MKNHIILSVFAHLGMGNMGTELGTDTRRQLGYWNKSREKMWEDSGFTTSERQHWQAVLIQ